MKDNDNYYCTIPIPIPIPRPIPIPIQPIQHILYSTLFDSTLLHSILLYSSGLRRPWTMRGLQRDQRDVELPLVANHHDLHGAIQTSQKGFCSGCDKAGLELISIRCIWEFSKKRVLFWGGLSWRILGFWVNIRCPWFLETPKGDPS